MLKELIEAKESEMGQEFLARCSSVGLTLDDIENAKLGVVEKGVELSLSALLMIDACEVITLATGEMRTNRENYLRTNIQVMSPSDARAVLDAWQSE